MVLHLLDARSGMTAADEATASQLPGGVEQIALFNKCDLASGPSRQVATDGRVSLWLSAKTGAGMDALDKELLRVAGWQTGDEDVFLARERHLTALEKALKYLRAAQAQPDHLELFAEELRLAQESLRAIVR